MLPVVSSMLGLVLNPHGEPGAMRPGQYFIIQLACSIMREMTTLLSTVWEGRSLETRRMHVRSIRHPENLSTLLFKREILSAH
jgi:hypothetical protein